MTLLQPAPRPPADALTTRELDVLRLVGEGRANKEIATALDLSERTVRTHVSSILGKLGLSSRTQAALWAAREGARGPRAPGRFIPRELTPRRPPVRA